MSLFDDLSDAASIQDVEDDDDDVDDDDEMAVSTKVEVLISSTTTAEGEAKRIKAHRETGKVVLFHVQSSHGHTTDSLLNFLLCILRALPKVKKVQISANQTPLVTRQASENLDWPVRLLTGVLEELSHRQVYSVRLCCMKLMGTLADFQELSATIRKVSTLEKFSLDKISLGGSPTGREGCWLDLVVQALATLPHLQHLRILGASDFVVTPHEEEEPVVVLQSSTLRQLCKSTKLRSLCLIHFNLTDDNVAQMAEQLETNVSVKELDIDCTLGTASSIALTRLVERNRVLEDLNLCVRSPEDEDQRARLGLNNRQITDQEKAITIAAEDEINLRLVSGVGKSTLINFALFRGRLSMKIQDAFRSMMVKQSCLESLTLYTGDDNLNKTLSEDPVIAFYCKLNHFGRRQLLLEEPTLPRNASIFGSSITTTPLPCPRSVFAPELALVDTLARVGDDLSCIFYFLSMKPSLCGRAIQKEESSNNKKRKQRRPASESPSKRTRLYRAAKYRGVSYTT